MSEWHDEAPGQASSAAGEPAEADWTEPDPPFGEPEAPRSGEAAQPPAGAADDGAADARPDEPASPRDTDPAQPPVSVADDGPAGAWPAQRSPSGMPPDSAAPDPSALSYEQASARLEAIIGRLDSGQAGLRETLDLCAEGRALIERCATELEAVGRGLEELRLDELVARLDERGEPRS